MFGDHNGDPISLKELHKRESVNGDPITMIAVTRKQFNEINLAKYKEYVMNELGLPRFYHGVNKHDTINDGLSQVMGLTIYKNGEFKNIKNEM